ncbi:hypothetical protein E4U32_007033 [Claviceps aff. humidiphila group G2b]|nr:hypothetical protein E4U32_007033 [Claviceps aff. humidiphila group G2b]
MKSLEIKEKDERDCKRRRLQNVEVTSLREEKEKAVQKMNAVVQENQGLKLETQRSKQETERAERETEELKREIEGSPRFKYMNISQKTLHAKLGVEQNPKRRTTGAGVTKIDGKVYPHDVSFVKPWKGFLNEQRVKFEAVCQAFPLDYRGFHCSKTLDDISKQSVTPIANEPEVSDFISINIETPVKTIFDKTQIIGSGIPDGKVCDSAGSTVQLIFAELLTTSMNPVTQCRGSGWLP